MAKQPLAEVFGFPIENQTEQASRHRSLKLCPYNNKVPNCTKDKAAAPLGVCSVLENGKAVVTCPVRFREDWLIAEDAASFFFPKDANWTSLTEVRLKDINGESAGNIDVVLVSYDKNGELRDFGALEIQAVYISGNVRNPFEHYMENPKQSSDFDWSKQKNYPSPDFLSSSRKRLAPQLLFKGGILHSWHKKSAVALDLSFFETLPKLQECDKNLAEVAWFVYDLVLDVKAKKYTLKRVKTVYTKFNESLQQITVAKPGKVVDFVATLQDKLNEKLDGLTPPINVTLDELL